MSEEAGNRRIGAMYFQTGVVIALALIESLLGFKIVAARFGALGFSEYSLGMRAIALLHPPLLLGMSVGLPRYVASIAEKDRPFRANAYARAAVLAVSTVVMLVAIPLLIAPSPFASLIGLPGRRAIVRGLSILLIGTCLNAVAYAHYRGLFRIRAANTLFGVNYVAVPLIAILVGHSIAQVFLIQGLTILGTSSLWLLRAGVGRKAAVWSELEELLRFGVRRVPGEFMLFGLLSLPPLYAAHVRGIVDAGIFAFAVAILSAIGSLFSSISMVLLPHASDLLARRLSGDLVHHVKVLILRVLAITGCILVGAEILAAVGLRLYLGSGFERGAATVRVVTLGIPGYCIYMTLRAVVDAYHYRAVNMKNGTLALAVTVFVLLLGRGTHLSTGPEWSVVAGTNVLALLTLRETWRIKEQTQSES